MKKLFSIALLMFSVSCFGQDTKGTIKVKKVDTAKSEIAVIEVLDSESLPSFPGGNIEMQKYLSKNVQYPQYELESGIQGSVCVSFVVTEDGSISDVKLLRGVPGGPGLDKEAIRIVKMMPKWIPAEKEGNPVNVRFNMPIIFRLQ